MCVDANCFSTLDKSVKQDVYLADGKKTITEGVGSGRLIWESPEDERHCVLSDVMCVSHFESNLISVKKQGNQRKLVCLPFPKQSNKKSKQPMDIIHTDVCEPMNTPKPRGCHYFLTMIDDQSRYTVVYFLKKKSEVTERIKEYVQFFTV